MEVVLGPEKVYLLGSGGSDRLDGCSEFWCASLLSVQYCNNQVCKGVLTLGCREMIKKGPPNGQDVIQYSELWFDILPQNRSWPITKA